MQNPCQIFKIKFLKSISFRVYLGVVRSLACFKENCFKAIFKEMKNNFGSKNVYKFSIIDGIKINKRLTLKLK